MTPSGIFELTWPSKNEDLSKALLNAANRFGFIIAGYSGRDESVMDLLCSALSTPNPFPHGLFWTGMKGAPVLPAVTQLIEDAKRAGVNAAFVEVETFDAFMLRVWRNIDGKGAAIDAKVRKLSRAGVSIPLPGPGTGPIIRMNALPVTSLPGQCQAITFRSAKDWNDLHAATSATEGNLIFTKSDRVLCWGREALIRDHFKDVIEVTTYDIAPMIADIGRNLHIKGFLEEAICHALVRGKPLLMRATKSGSYIIADAHNSDQSALYALQRVTGKTAGQVPGLLTKVDDQHPHPEKVFWAEALRVSLDIVSGQSWLLLDPAIWIWPPRARKDAATFLDERRGSRYNKVYNELLDAWLEVLLSGYDRDAEIKMSAYEGGTDAETPSFGFCSRTAYTRGLA